MNEKYNFTLYKSNESYIKEKMNELLEDPSHAVDGINNIQWAQYIISTKVFGKIITLKDTLGEIAEKERADDTIDFKTVLIIAKEIKDLRKNLQKILKIFEDIITETIEKYPGLDFIRTAIQEVEGETDEQ